MRKLLAVAVVLASAVAAAQEIGTEINPVTPGSAATPAPAENPYEKPPPPPAPPQQQKQGYQYRPSGQKAPSFEGPRMSAGGGDFGIRANFTASGTTAVTGTGLALSIGAPSVGVSFWATDEVALLFDLGFGVAISDRGSPPVALAATLGLDYHFRSPGVALRPIFSAAVSFNMVLTGNGDPNIGVSAVLGGGAAYFFSPNFALTGKLLLSVPIQFSPAFQIAFFSLTPGVGASWYF